MFIVVGCIALGPFGLMSHFCLSLSVKISLTFLMLSVFNLHILVGEKDSELSMELSSKFVIYSGMVY